MRQDFPSQQSGLFVQAAVQTAELTDFHHQLSLANYTVSEEGQGGAKWWRWRGFLTQYVHKGDQGPAVLLV
jgi:hypothetical protein